jgi:hypothetical protein
MLIERGHDKMAFDGVKSKVMQLVKKVVMRLLADPGIENRIWEISQGVVDGERHLQGNIRTQLWKNATEETVEYVKEKMLSVKSLHGRRQMFEMALSHVRIDGLYLEFGVENGDSINLLAEYVKETIHGFDSFEGLPEAWFDDLGKGALSTNSKVPVVAQNVELHIGWVDESLPKFVSTHDGQVAFMHIDCDLYSSTSMVFDTLGDRIRSGTVIVFDEYFNYPGWKNHEYKAFQEFVSSRGIAYEYLGYDRCYFSVAVII